MKNRNSSQKIYCLFLKMFLIIPLVLYVLLPFQAFSFAPLNNIIDDPTFRASGTMTEVQIQQFLEQKGSVLATYVVPDSYTDSSGYFRGSWIGPIGKEINAAGWKASKVIYQTSQWYGLNPQVTLATLQKEQSLVTSYYGESAIRWAMGYAVTDAGIINVCGTATNYNSTGSCAGFAMQVDWGAGTFITRYNSPSASFPVGSTRNICYTDGSSDCSLTYIANRATSSLYSYTPYYHGNYNFRNIFSLWFNMENYITASVSVSASLAFSNLTPAAGQTLQVGFALRNTTDSSLTIDVGVPDLNTQTGQWNSFASQSGITLTAGQTKTFSFSKTVKYPGPHRTWIAIGYDGVWYDAKPLANQMVAYAYQVKPVNNSVSVSASLAFSDLSLVAGQTLQVGFALKNTTNSPLTIDVGVPDLNTQTGQWNSFASQSGITLTAGQTKTFSFSKTVKYPGPHRTWIAIGYDGVWYDAKPLANQMTSYGYQVRIPNIRLDAYSFDTLPPKPEIRFNATLRITNLEANPIHVDSLAIPIYSISKSQWNTMLYAARDFSINSGQSYTLKAHQTLPTGYFRIWPSIIVGDYPFTPKTSTGIEMYWLGTI